MAPNKLAKCSQLGNGLFPRWERDIPTLGTKRSHVGNTHRAQGSRISSTYQSIRKPYCEIRDPYCSIRKPYCNSKKIILEECWWSVSGELVET